MLADGPLKHLSYNRLYIRILSRKAIPCTAAVPKNVNSIYRGAYIASTHKREQGFL